MATRLSTLDNELSARGTKVDALFESYDQDGDGAIDRKEFGSLFNRILQHVKQEHQHEQEAEIQLKSSKRRAMAFAVLSLSFFIMLGVSVAANAAVVYYFVYGAKDTQVGADGQFTTTTGDSVVTGLNHVEVVELNESSGRRRLHEHEREFMLAPNLCKQALHLIHSTGNPMVEVTAFEDKDIVHNTVSLLDETADGYYFYEHATEEEFFVPTFTEGEPCYPVYLNSTDDLDDSTEDVYGSRNRRSLKKYNAWANRKNKGRKSGCHPAASILTACDGSLLRMDGARIGDPIRTPHGCEPIVGIVQSDPAEIARYNTLTTTGNLSIRISDGHFLFVDGAEAEPATVKIGQTLSTVDGPQIITSVAKETHVGAYHFVTPSGAYYVDGIAASTYAAGNEGIPLSVWKIIGDKYITLRYRIGYPVQPVQEAQAVSPLWLLHLTMDYGIESYVWPLTVLFAVATEIISSTAMVANSMGSGTAGILTALIAFSLAANIARK